ncbi:hypothetical protein GGR55DRAFT_540502 [Xylaria sp. FL0064]|nr:hypothetical protein GGR55DRAFT_540502 [Xylaria sp. FL0064]
MSLQRVALLSVLTLGVLVKVRAESTQSLYGQCGGINYTGPTKCPKTATCYNDGTNPWYSQCVETPWDNGGSHPTSTTVTTSKPTTTSKTTITIKTTTTTTKAPTTTESITTTPSVTTIITTLPPRTTTPAGGKTTTVTLTPDDPYTEDRARQNLTSFTDLPTADSSFSNHKRQSSPGTTLQPGWYWIRAVVQPNYHKYLQTKPANAPGTAILESYRTAGQFKVDSGQLIANTGTGSAALYLHVEKPTDFTQRTLATWFNTTQNEFGTFAWQGDALTWSMPEVKRQNLAAWLVCTGQALFINTGAYAYQTPSGCSDQTIHYYNDAHANE